MKKKHATAALLAAVVLTLASCGTNAGAGGNQGGGDMQSMDHGGSGGERSQQAARETDHGAAPGQEEKTGGGMAGMDHGDNMGGMDHGGTGSGDMAAMSREMVMPNGKYSDKAFIDAMVPHHEGAVEMAEVALRESEREEIRELSEGIISTQEAEIETLGAIREEEFGSSESEMEMSEEDMAAMGMSDPEELAQADPFDKAFIDEMIVHHESAVEMASVAFEESENEEIRRLAGEIVSAQEREIAQMEEWRQEWYPEG